MAVRVLVVDDSAFFRKRIMEILKADVEVEVVGGAANGREAVDMVTELKPDVVTMDIEMPVMDGISAVREIMSKSPTPVLMFSSLTHEGAKATLDALDAGAMDFLPKKFEDIASNRDEAISQFRQRVRLLGRRRAAAVARPALKVAGGGGAGFVAASGSTRPSARPNPRLSDYQLLIIGASTGGPVALQKILSRLPANFPLPVVVVQHMPATFTATFAQRLNDLCKLNVKEAEDGDELKAGCAYIAPGGRQLTIQRNVGRARIVVRDSNPSMFYKPCVDLAFDSVAAAYRNDVLAIVLTGMGADGCEGARKLKRNGAAIWAQDEASCVVYGMPAAIVNAGLADHVLSVDDIARVLSQPG
jgi:two-component system chemotaxis response regulator CheB